jgi:hypothetical protein
VSAGTLRHVVEHALTRHLDAFAEAFPPGFDWQALCADAPRLVERLASGATTPASEHVDADDDDGFEDDDEPGFEREGDAAVAPEIDLVGASEETFAAAYVGALAGIALAVEDERDPDLLVEELVRPLAEEDEEAFERLAEGSLDPVERALAGRGPTPDEESVTGLAVTLTEAAWPGVEVALEGVAVLDPERGTDLPSAVRQVLGGVARVAAILAAFRWLADGKVR